MHALSQAATGFPATQAAVAIGIPSKEQIQVAARKMVQETPPFVHLSKTDSAPQLKIEDHLTVRGGMRGYRTARATHGVNSGDFYFECWIQEGASVEEIKNQLPPNVRLAPKLKQQLESGSATGGHTRVGWSTRLGDLQAPVGYDRYSYGYRDIKGSRVHNSRRDDDWGSEPYGPGDIIGCCISSEMQQIHFFRNGEAMGTFILSRGKREGGAAFTDIPSGTYYPAVSVYLGASVRAHFGPHFVYPPRKLPHGMKPKPVSDLCEKPLTDITACLKQVPKKTDEALVKALEEALQEEAEIRQQAYAQHLEQQTAAVKKEREARNLSTNDLI
jgi:Set1/Ash2 histone methyltransferase complex subunit ASH2